jgi:Cu/Ag efflux protein CusF
LPPGKNATDKHASRPALHISNPLKKKEVKSTSIGGSIGMPHALTPPKFCGGKTMRKMFLILLAVSLLAGLTVMAAAAAPNTGKASAPAQQTLRLEGEVTTVNPAAKTFSIKEGERTVEFSWNETTRVTESKHAVTESAIVTGEKVMVHYTEMSGKNVAHSIVVMSPHSPQASAHSQPAKSESTATATPMKK